MTKPIKKVYIESTITENELIDFINDSFSDDEIGQLISKLLDNIWEITPKIVNKLSNQLKNINGN